MKIDFRLSFEENFRDLIIKGNRKGKIARGGDNYYVLRSLFNQNYIDNEEGRVRRSDGTRIKNTAQRVWDLENKYEIEGIRSRWVDGVRSKYKQYWISRRESNV